VITTITPRLQNEWHGKSMLRAQAMSNKKRAGPNRLTAGTFKQVSGLMGLRTQKCSELLDPAFLSQTQKKLTHAFAIISRRSI